jgi:site-specific DNA-methyltransferase (adenine-specific)/site-specific DNA-methyltransferase (cytosine-N4-specific)
MIEKASNVIVYGDARDIEIEPNSIDCVVTSPPYFGLRSYGDSEREIGRGSLEDYVKDLVRVAEQMFTCVKDTGVFWLNIGDTASGSGGAGGDFKPSGSKKEVPLYRQGETGLRKGQWCLVPERVAIGIQENTSWLLRSMITWNKATLRPESPKHTKRPGVASEKIMMFSKTMNYKFNYNLLLEDGMDRGDVWTFPPYRGKRKHMAPFPDELPRRCIMLTTEEGDTVLDPFVGSGTTLRVANDLGRNGVGVDIYSYESSIEGEAK